MVTMASGEISGFSALAYSSKVSGSGHGGISGTIRSTVYADRRMDTSHRQHQRTAWDERSVGVDAHWYCDADMRPCAAASWPLPSRKMSESVSYTHLRAHETV